VVKRGRIQVLCNLEKSAHVFAVSSRARILLESRDGAESGIETLKLPPDAVAIVMD